MTSDRRGPTPERESVTGGFSPSVDFASSVIAGLALGIAFDWVFSTRPVFIIVFIVAGFVAGFIKLWRTSAVLEEMAEERRRGF